MCFSLPSTPAPAPEPQEPWYETYQPDESTLQFVYRKVAEATEAEKGNVVRAVEETVAERDRLREEVGELQVKLTAAQRRLSAVWNAVNA